VDFRGILADRAGQHLANCWDAPNYLHAQVAKVMGMFVCTFTLKGQQLIQERRGLFDTHIWNWEAPIHTLWRSVPVLFVRMTGWRGTDASGYQEHTEAFFPQLEGQIGQTIKKVPSGLGVLVDSCMLINVQYHTWVTSASRNGCNRFGIVFPKF
jgi:hypothetical protein